MAGPPTGQAPLLTLPAAPAPTPPGRGPDDRLRRPIDEAQAEQAAGVEWLESRPPFGQGARHAPRLGLAAMLPASPAADVDGSFAVALVVLVLTISGIVAGLTAAADRHRDIDPPAPGPEAGGASVGALAALAGLLLVVPFVAAAAVRMLFWMARPGPARGERVVLVAASSALVLLVLLTGIVL